jgi:uncharacterized heparinase superfamily protein
MEFLKYFHTIRYLKASQLLGRVRHRLVRPKVDMASAPALRHINGQWTCPACRVPSMPGAETFRFLNETRTLQGQEDWNDPQADKLWLYNLHYFDDLNAGKAEDRKEWHEALLSRWVAENPPGTGNGWEPYPSSLRIVNWIKWALAGNVLPKDVEHSLAVQVRYLMGQLEYHLLGNHLFANAKALVFAGAFFQGPEAEVWMRTGLGILRREILEQILSDGGQFERSPMYHGLALEDMCDLINIVRAYPDSVLARYANLVSTWPGIALKMGDWLRAVCHPDGEIALFNDAAIGVAPHPSRLLGYCERLGVFQERSIQNEEEVGAESLLQPQQCKRLSDKGCTCTHLESTGYVRLAAKNATAILDTAPIGPDYLPGHAHADTLSFELSVYGQRVIVDTATSTYAIGDERQRQRSTAAHNTVVIDDQDSSEVWSGFRVARRAYPRNLAVNEFPDGRIHVSCEHDGYRRLSGKPVHARQWHFSPDSLQIVDAIKGKYNSAEARFHMHPDILCEKVSDNELKLSLGDRQIMMIFAAKEVSLVDSTYHPEFGLSFTNICLSVPFTGRLVTDIIWDT